MPEILLLYRQVALRSLHSGGLTAVLMSVAVEGKPEHQVHAHPLTELPPSPRAATVDGDHDGSLPGTCFILAGLDLHDGHVTGRVERHHRSREFIALLKDLDGYYPAACTIRLILDDHAAHRSKETRGFLAMKPSRFTCVLAPTHKSWLKLVETLFEKMMRTFLHHLRARSWEEMRDRILGAMEEFNADPVAHQSR